MFNKAEKKKSKLRLALEGASGSGKTFSALIIAAALGEKVALIDTEHGSASLYSDRFDFDVAELNGDYAPERYIEMIEGAEQGGYDVLVIDSLSHEWEGTGGCLDIQGKLGGRFQDWAKVTPRHNALINKILSSPLHIIVTMRTKAEYVVEENKKGKAAPQKVGTAPRQRDGMEYEFTAVLSLNQNHMASSSKDRTSLFDGKDFKITRETGESLINWLNSGVDVQAIVEGYQDKLKGAKNLQELQAQWQLIPRHFRADCTVAKDVRKAELSNPQESEEAA